MASGEMSALPTRKAKIGEGKAVPPKCRKPILSFSPTCFLAQFKSLAAEVYSLQYFWLKETGKKAENPQMA